jgi:hypothetical protein
MRAHRLQQRDPAGEVLVRRIDLALAELEQAQADLTTTLVSGAPLVARREAFAHVTRAFAAADAPLREVTRHAKTAPYGKGSYRVWSHWRHLLSTLDVAEQRHLFAQSDDVAALEMGSVQALDTGMAGPSIGELQHGEASEPGATPGYGLDMDVAMAPPAPVTRPPAPVTAPTPAPQPAQPIAA